MAQTTTIARAAALFGTAAVAALLAACSTPPALVGADQAAGCAGLGSAGIAPEAIGLPSAGARITSATWMAPAALSVAERGPTPASTITPATPAYCKLLGQIAPLDPNAPPILFQVNLPAGWNGRSVQYGGGGYNGVLISGLALVPAAPFDKPAPLAQGFVTVGTDSGHQNKPGESPMAFALNDEALVNFAHASYKKVRDVSLELMKRAYGRAPQKMYFVGSSEGGREGLTMAQRYPAAFNGIFSRVPVIHWTALQHVGLRDGLASAGDGWIAPAKVKLVGDAVLAACDSADGLADGIVSDPVGCRARFDVERLRCSGGAGGDGCLTDAQIRAVRTLQSPLRLDFELANGLRQYPGRGPSGEALAAYASTGGWMAWWTGSSAPAFPPQPGNGNAWVYGAGAIQYFYARDPQIDLRQYDARRYLPRVQQISLLMDSTDPDLGAFQERGGKLILLENLADYAQSPYAGLQYAEAVLQRLGPARTAGFMRTYTAPGVDHVGTGAPANADFLSALVDWVESDRPPPNMQLIEQSARPPFAVLRARPLCLWPQWPRYRGGDAALAASFECTP